MTGPDSSATSASEIEIEARIRRAREMIAAGLVKSVTVEAVVRRANGSVEDMGVVAYDGVEPRTIEYTEHANDAGITVRKGHLR